jgi:hypothetical protein
VTAEYCRHKFEQAHARLRSDPAALTTGDLEQLAMLSPELAHEGVAARQAALSPAPVPSAPATAPASKGGLSQESIEAIAEGIVTFVGEQVVPILRRLDALEQQPPSPRYAGTYEQQKRYGRGALVTRSGGLWLAIEDTTETPGRSDRWKLIVKSGECPR